MAPKCRNPQRPGMSLNPLELSLPQGNSSEHMCVAWTLRLLKFIGSGAWLHLRRLWGPAVRVASWDVKASQGRKATARARSLERRI